MTLQKAIEILDNAASEIRRPEDPDLWDAMCLGIEALKREKERRGYAQQFNWLPLPGETTEANEAKQ